MTPHQFEPPKCRVFVVFDGVKACIHWIFTFLQKTWIPFRGSLHTKIPNYRKKIIKTQFLCFFTLNTSFCKKIWFFEKHVITPEKRYEKSVKTPQNDVKHAYTHPKSCFLKNWKTVFTLCTRHKKHKKVFKNIFFIFLQFFDTFWRFYTVGKCFSFELFVFFTKLK